MFVVYVELRVTPDRMDEFLPLMLENATTSLETEAGCLQFDVVHSTEDDDLIQLYEVYTDAAAFDVHLASDHFKKFDAEVEDLVRAKRVKLGKRLSPA